MGDLQAVVKKASKNKKGGIPKRSMTHKQKYAAQFVRTWKNKIARIAKHVRKSPGDKSAARDLKVAKGGVTGARVRGLCRRPGVADAA